MRWALFLTLVALAAWSHVHRGAYSSEFGAFEDEPAHLVSALMIRDWLAGGDYRAPLAFAQDYYVHYPKVAIGQWPPVFHGTLGVWMLVFGTSTLAIGAFSSLLVATLAFVVALVVARPFGHFAGGLAGALYLASPVVQSTSASAMTETMIALLATLALLAFGRFVDTGRARWAQVFAAAAALTILTKGSGLALALVPPLVLVVQRRFDLLTRPALWASAATVAAMTAPWYLATVSISQSTWSGGALPSMQYVALAVRSYAGWLPGLAGPVALLLVPIGVVSSCRMGEQRGRWTALGAWIPALLLLHLVVPSSVDDRHLAVLAPQWAIFTAVGAVSVVRGAARVLPRLRAASARAGGPATAAVAIACALALTLALRRPAPPKAWRGYGPIASTVVALGDAASPRVLVASDPTGEGLLVAGFALADDPRPSRYVLRASKVLGRADWCGRDYLPAFEAPEAVARFLDERGVGVVILDRTVRGTRRWYEHMDQLEALTDDPSGGWSLAGIYGVERAGSVDTSGVAVFLREDWSSLPVPDLRLEDVLERDIMGAGQAVSSTVREPADPEVLATSWGAVSGTTDTKGPGRTR